MKKIDLGNTISIIANLGVIGGIVFLGIELHQTQLAMEAQAYQARAFDAIEGAYTVMEDRELQALLADYQSGVLTLEALDEDQKRILRRWYFIIRTDLDNEHYQYENGFLDPDFYRTTTVLGIKFDAPHWRALGVSEPRESFSSEVDRILADPSIGQ